MIPPVAASRTKEFSDVWASEMPFGAAYDGPEGGERRMQYGEGREAIKPFKPSSVPEPGFAKRISTRDVFERMIEHELRSGRLTRGRRRRIVRYAARLGMSAVEAGRFLDTCRANALASDNPAERLFALRLVDAPTNGEPQIGKLTIAVAAGVLLTLLLTVWSR